MNIPLTKRVNIIIFLWTFHKTLSQGFYTPIGNVGKKRSYAPSPLKHSHPFSETVSQHVVLRSGNLTPPSQIRQRESYLFVISLHSEGSPKTRSNRNQQEVSTANQCRLVAHLLLLCSYSLSRGQMITWRTRNQCYIFPTVVLLSGYNDIR